MLPRSRRLSRTAFDLIRTSTLLVSNPSASLRFQCRRGTVPGRFSVVVPRAVDSRAVVRNRWRRRTYRIIQQTAGLEGIDGIFYIRKSKINSYALIAPSIQDLLGRAIKRCHTSAP
ncbi:MAG: hypothetical protein A3C06_03550 [Candidatus Taylorbacteria bacterium RIFCSPHIGHO2_02_FULL_46_13]|uniref:Uncharacterized protein n=1 Tax=Candidatus Taylorbacteria bacterium RIFCSPHIGHO2_02_FULL_46_13 TaxID=1802312 RepID=A0A1G2MQN1_9BACT|nr:MAG: hypothetical protein A3C06_03550 [Candidatus Taylorbacteria bacterium RIFCSPHIGHO2_02_FULL_46_13]